MNGGFEKAERNQRKRIGGEGIKCKRKDIKGDEAAEG